MCTQVFQLNLHDNQTMRWPLSPSHGPPCRRPSKSKSAFLSGTIASFKPLGWRGWIGRYQEAIQSVGSTESLSRNVAASYMATCLSAYVTLTSHRRDSRDSPRKSRQITRLRNQPTHDRPSNLQYSKLASQRGTRTHVNLNPATLRLRARVNMASIHTSPCIP